MLVQIPVSQTAVPNAVVAMREWLDRNGCPETRFETGSAETDAIMIRVEFRTVRPAIAFCQAFDPIAVSH